MVTPANEVTFSLNVIMPDSQTKKIDREKQRLAPHNQPGAAGHPTARVDGRDQVQNSRMNENVHALRYIQNIRGVSDWNTSVAEYQSCSGGNSLSIAEKATDYFFCSGV